MAIGTESIRLSTQAHCSIKCLLFRITIHVIGFLFYISGHFTPRGSPLSETQGGYVEGTNHRKRRSQYSLTLTVLCFHHKESAFRS